MTIIIHENAEVTDISWTKQKVTYTKKRKLKESLRQLDEKKKNSKVNMGTMIVLQNNKIHAKN